ncbi:MAG: Gfo/Idh/MocA family oxidoreductase [Chloroflexi bacterium]|nr:Gfo/Idh/MocA family oxidoreductase [Chloroflexota bacterium]
MTEDRSIGRPFSIGIIGAGGIAQKLHLPQLAGMPEFKVTWLCGRRESRLERLADQFGVPRWTHDPADLYGDAQLDAVIVATPHPLHAEAGLAALAAGKHLMIQKPLCAEMAEADRLVDAADASDRTVLCLPHFSPEVYRAREIAAAGDLGKPSGAHCRTSHGGPEVYYAEVRDGFRETDNDLWFFDAKRAAVGALFDMGVYAVAALVATLGSVVSVMAMTATIDKPTALEDTATLLLQFENGAIGTAETGWCDPARTWAYRIHGTAGKLTMPGEGGASMTHWTPGSYTREDIPPVPRPVDTSGYDIGNVHRHFLDCIRSGVQPPLSNVRAARHVTEILLAGLQSARTGERVSIHSRDR